jgi:hypothetical protein
MFGGTGGNEGVVVRVTDRIVVAIRTYVEIWNRPGRGDCQPVIFPLRGVCSWTLFDSWELFIWWGSGC